MPRTRLHDGAGSPFESFAPSVVPATLAGIDATRCALLTSSFDGAAAALEAPNRAMIAATAATAKRGR
jgi:hypothetical protein